MQFSEEIELSKSVFPPYQTKYIDVQNLVWFEEKSSDFRSLTANLSWAINARPEICRPVELGTQMTSRRLQTDIPFHTMTPKNLLHI